MKHLYPSRKMSRVFRGSVLALALLLVACGGDADEPTPTATSGADQSALPTVPALESTPAVDVSEDEITILDPQEPATAEASTPDANEVATPDEDEDVAEETPLATPNDGPIDLTQNDVDDEVDVVSTPNEGEATSDNSTPSVESDSESDVATPPETDATDMADATPPAGEAESADPADEASGVVASPDAAEEDEQVAIDQPTERPRTGEETFDHPGDGTGGSGMPGENSVNVLDGDNENESPAASPVAQLEISGCEVPDVPGFLGDTSTFILTVDVNFRSGPGVDCEPLMDDPLGVGQTVEVTGGPVTQTEDDSEWVQIEIDGQPGWITTEFIEPVD